MGIHLKSGTLEVKGNMDVTDPNISYTEPSGVTGETSFYYRIVITNNGESTPPVFSLRQSYNGPNLATQTGAGTIIMYGDIPVGLAHSQANASMWLEYDQSDDTLDSFSCIGHTSGATSFRGHLYFTPTIDKATINCTLNWT